MKAVDMNRSTFYQYFDDIEDLLRQSADDLVDEFVGAWDNIGDGIGAPGEMSVRIRRFLYPDRAKKAVIMMWSGACPDLFDRMRAVASENMSLHYPSNGGPEAMDGVAGLIIMVCMGVAARHMRSHDDEEAFREMGLYEGVAYNGMSLYLGKADGESAPPRGADKGEGVRRRRAGGRPRRRKGPGCPPGAVRAAPPGDDDVTTNKEMSDATRRKIVDTFWEMAFEAGGIGKTTVWSLMKRVDMNRSTFYEYFDGIEDLLRHSADAIVEEIGEVWESVNAEAEDAEAAGRMFSERRGADTNRKLLLLMWSGACPDLFDRVRSVTADSLAGSFGGEADREDLELVSGLMLMIGTGVTARHMGDGTAADCEDEIEWYQSIAFVGMGKYLGGFKPDGPVGRSRRTRAPPPCGSAPPARTARRGRTKRGTGSPRRPPRRTCGRTRRRTPRRTRSGSCSPR